jgi:hypothetical protein
MAQILPILVYLLGPSGLAFVSLASRLRWQARRDQRRQDTLRALTSRILETSVIEINEVRDDGSQLLMRIAPASTACWTSDE